MVSVMILRNEDILVVGESISISKPEKIIEEVCAAC